MDSEPKNPFSWIKNKLMRTERKPNVIPAPAPEAPKPITSQARVMRPQEYLDATADMAPKDKDSEVLRMQSESLQDLTKRRTKAMNTAAAVATLVTMGGVKAVVDNPPDIGQGVRSISQGIVDTRERLKSAQEPGTAKSNESKRALDASRAPQQTPGPNNPFPVMEPPEPIAIPTEKPKQV